MFTLSLTVRGSGAGSFRKRRTNNVQKLGLTIGGWCLQKKIQRERRILSFEEYLRVTAKRIRSSIINLKPTFAGKKCSLR